MGNIGSSREKNQICQDDISPDIRPLWTTEMWSPDLCVLMSSDSKHVVVRYRTKGTEILELRAVATDKKVGRELIEFGKNLHKFTTNVKDARTPTFSLFLSNCDESSHQNGFVEVGVSRQVVEADSDGEETRNNDSDKAEEINAEINEEIISKTVSQAQHSHVDPVQVLLDTQEEKKTKSHTRVNTTPNKHDLDLEKQYGSLRNTVSPKIRKNLRRTHSSPASKRNETLSHGITVQDIKTFRSNAKSKAGTSVINNDIKLLNAGQNGKAEIRQLGALKQENPVEDQAIDTSDTDDTLTPSTEVELSDSERYSYVNKSELKNGKNHTGSSNGAAVKNLPKKVASSTKIFLEKPDMKSIITQKTGRSAQHNNKPTFGRNRQKQNQDDKDPRQEAWLAFVRTLQHHDVDACSDTTLSDFSDYEVERKLSLGPSD